MEQKAGTGKINTKYVMNIIACCLQVTFYPKMLFRSIAGPFHTALFKVIETL